MPAGLTLTVCRTNAVCRCALTALTLLLCVSVTARGQSSGQPVCGKGTVIVFGNGMFSERTDVEDSKLKLQLLVPAGAIETDPQAVFYDIAYNFNEVWYEQLSEVALQKIGDIFSSFWDWVSGIEVAPDWFRDTALEINRVYISSINDSDLDSHVSTYKSYLQEGNRILIVSHSQGNFYANRAYLRLRDEFGSSVGNVQVATPANANLSGGPWTTFFDDLVMLAVRGVTGALPANIFTPGIGFPPNGDLLGHSFIKAYLRVGAARSKIISDIVNVSGGLQYPDAISRSGVITITLTWGAQPDVDLHVFEPSGTHVYYAALNGQSGFLDVDDVTSFGPEHYFVSCDTLQEGDYVVGVNYYHGFAPEVATINFRAGSDLAQTSITLPSAVGGAGDNSPIIVGVVKVRKDTDGRFTFELSVQ